MSSPATIAIPPSVSYASELWDGFNGIVDKAKNGIRTLDKLIYYMKEKAVLDQYYSKTLKKLASTSLGSLEGTTFQSSLTQFEGLNTILAENHEILAAKILEQVRKPLELLRDSLSKANKTLLNSGQTLIKEHASAYSQLEKSRSRCEQACRASQAARKAARLAAESERERANTLSDPAQLAQLAQNSTKAKKKAQDLSKDAIAADRQYMADVKATRSFRAKYDANMTQILAQCEQLEINRSNGIVASMKHYMTIQQGMTESVHKTVQVVSHMMERMDGNADLREFIVNRMTGRQPDPLPEYEQFEGHPMGIPQEEPLTAAPPKKQPDDDDEDERDEDTQEDSDNSAAAAYQRRASGPEPEKLTTDQQRQLQQLQKRSSIGSATGKPDDGDDDDDDEVVEFDAATVTKASAKPAPKVEKKAASGFSTHLTVPADGNDSSHSTDSAASGGSYVVISDEKGDGTGHTISASSSSSSVNRAPNQDEERAKAETIISNHLRHILWRGVRRPYQNVPPSPSDNDFEDLGRPSPRAPTVEDDFVDAAAEPRDKEAEQRATAEVKALFKTAAGREAFAFVLNQQRNAADSLHLQGKEAFDALADLVLSFLDEARASMHVRPAQLVMIMSQTFFYVPLPDDPLYRRSSTAPAGSKVYLQERIKSHPIWKQMRFWEEAFFDSYTQALKKHNKHQKVQKWHSDLEQADALQAQKNIIFAQLGTFAHNMNEFSMDPLSTKDFIVKMCRINELDKEHEEMLMNMPGLLDAPALPRNPSTQSAKSDEDGADLP